MNRELLYAALSYDQDGRPVLRVVCDCATVTDIILHIGAEAEFAVTCDGCTTVRWFYINPVGGPS